MDEKKELIWVPARVAEAHKNAESPEEKDKIVMDHVKEMTHSFKESIMGLDESALLIKAAGAKARIILRDALTEHTAAIEEVWNQWEEKTQKVRDFSGKIEAQAKTIRANVGDIEKAIEKIQTYRIQSLLETLEKINSMLTGPHADAIKILVDRYSEEKNGN